MDSGFFGRVVGFKAGNSLVGSFNGIEAESSAQAGNYKKIGRRRLLSDMHPHGANVIEGILRPESNHVVLRGPGPAQPSDRRGRQPLQGRCGRRHGNPAG